MKLTIIPSMRLLVSLSLLVVPQFANALVWGKVLDRDGQDISSQRGDWLGCSLVENVNKETFRITYLSGHSLVVAVYATDAESLAKDKDLLEKLFYTSSGAIKANKMLNVQFKSNSAEIISSNICSARDRR